jgi:hypothetical protein
VLKLSIDISSVKYGTIYALQVEIERLHCARKRGKVLINVSEEIMKKIQINHQGFYLVLICA